MRRRVVVVLLRDHRRRDRQQHCRSTHLTQAHSGSSIIRVSSYSNFPSSIEEGKPQPDTEDRKETGQTPQRMRKSVAWTGAPFAITAKVTAAALPVPSASHDSVWSVVL